MNESLPKWIGAAGGITAILISVGGVVYGSGSQSGQIGPLGDRVHSLEAKLDVAVSDIADLRRQMSVLDTKMTGIAATSVDSFKSLENKLASAVSNVASLSKEVSLLDSRTTQNTSALAEAYKKFNAVNPMVQRCLDLTQELESGGRSTSMGWFAINPKDVLGTMRELNCNSMPRSP